MRFAVAGLVGLAVAATAASSRAQAIQPASAPPKTESPSPPISTTQRDEDYAATVTVAGEKLTTPRGIGDVRIRRELLEASPRQQTSELLSAAPGLFVDHEDGEGLGNDVYLRGFDLDHGSGIEFRVSSVPINIPTHVLGSGYADLNFILPEVVRSLHVLEGVYDPRQGDAAIAGSVDLDLGVVERGYRASVSYGSFNQARVAGVLAPRGEDEETFAAFALRRTDGFGPDNRGSASATANAQYAFELDKGYRIRLFTAAYASSAKLPGVVRQDDVSAGTVGLYDSYASPYAGNQSVTSSRFVAGLDLDHLTTAGHFEVTTWAMVTALRLRQNYTGNLQSKLGDLLESTNDETSAGASARFQTVALKPASFLSFRAEPGVSMRYGAGDQTQSMLSPVDLVASDRRVDAGVRTLDVGGYLDLEARLFQRLHLAGGVRVDALDVEVDNRLAHAPPTCPASSALDGAHRSAFGVPVSPRVSAGFDATSWLTPVISYGEGFRSLDTRCLADGSTQPYSKVRSVEVGLRAHLLGDRYVASLAFFETWVGNELVFDATAGGLETEGASVRRGLVASVVARPLPWLLGSFALSLNHATYDKLSDDGNHLVPSVPPLLFRADVTARGRLLAIAGQDVTGRVGAGFTLLAPRHVTDTVLTDPNYVLNAGASARYRMVELGVDGYNLLGLHYADDEDYFRSNWLRTNASYAAHLSAAAPLTVVATLTLHL